MRGKNDCFNIGVNGKMFSLSTSLSGHLRYCSSLLPPGWPHTHTHTHPHTHTGTSTRVPTMLQVPPRVCVFSQVEVLEGQQKQTHTLTPHLLKLLLGGIITSRNDLTIGGSLSGSQVSWNRSERVKTLKRFVMNKH